MNTHPTNPSPKKRFKPVLLIGLCLAIIGVAAWSIYRTQFNAPKYNVMLHEGIGRALAEETARILDGKGEVVGITINPAGFPELKTQVRAFELALQQHPKITLEKLYQVDTENKPKYSFGSGLSGRRYVRVVNKNLSADAFVSFIGAPTMTTEEVAQLQKRPKFIAEVRSPDKLKELFKQKVIHCAVVSRFQFPTPIKGTPRTPAQWFEQRFQIVTASTAHELPDPIKD